MAIYQGNKKLAYACNVDNSAYSVPVGTILSYASATPPVGFLVCDGSEVSKTLYADLYTIIGDTYGTSTDASKFKLPDLRDKFVQGANGNLGTSKEAGLPNITGDFIPGSVPASHSKYAHGSFFGIIGVDSLIAGTPDLTINGFGYGFDASNSNSIYGNSDTVQPPSVCLVFIIKALKVSDKYADTPKDIYSTDEVVTDKVWIDGKPIYRKVVNLGTLPNTSTKDIPHGISNIEFITNISGVAKKASGDFLPLPYLWKSSTEDVSISIFVNTTKVTVMTLNDRTDTNGYIFVEYTKTTD